MLLSSFCEDVDENFKSTEVSMPCLFQSSQYANPFSLSHFTNSTTDLIKILNDRNETLITGTKGSNVVLRSASGTESLKELEDIFINNYLLVTASTYCEGASMILHGIIYIIGFLTRYQFIIRVDNFITNVKKEVQSELVGACVEWIRPEQIFFSDIEFCIVAPNKTQTLVSSLVKSSMKNMGTIFENQIVISILQMVSAFVETSASVYYALKGANSHNYMLTGKLPTCDFSKWDVILVFAKKWCENSMKTKQSEPVRRAITKCETLAEKAVEHDLDFTL